MKLRLRENSLRLRLLQKEVQQLKETGMVSERIIFGANSDEVVTYSLIISDREKTIRAQVRANLIEVFLPRSEAENWIDSNAIGLYAAQIIDDSRELKITVEKDFVCVDRPGDEDNEDAFPHPQMNC